VQMQQVPPDVCVSDDEDEDNPDVRESQKFRDDHVEPDNEYYRDDQDNDDEELEV